MKIYAITDEYNKKTSSLAWLMVYRNPTSFNIEISEKADPAALPMILDSFAKRGIYTVGSEWSLAWVQQRIVPPERQNIGRILKDNGLNEYDEADLLILGHGRCAQDDFCIREIRREELPDEIREREKDRIRDYAVLGDGGILLTFSDQSTARCPADRLMAYDSRIRRMWEQDPVAEDADLQVISGGTELRWGSGTIMTGKKLREIGDSIGLCGDDIRCLISQMTVNTAEAAEMMDCSRQYISELVKRGRLKPVRTDEKNMLFMKSDIESMMH